MKWRDVLIGVITTLVVTVVGGVILYYITREPPAPAPAEKLVYDTDTPVSFKSDQTQLSLANIRVKNIGNAPATNLLIGVSFPDKVKVVDHRVTLSSGPAGSFHAKLIGDNKVEVRIAVFTPDEMATVAILTDTVDDRRPTLGVKSDNSTGAKAPLTSFVRFSDPTADRVAGIVAVLVPLALLAQFFLLFVVRKRFRRAFRRFIPTSRDINNTAFVYLHRGLIQEAIELLVKGISDSGAEPHMLANYGLALGLNGDAERAAKILDAADFWADVNSHEQAVIAFNRAILSFTQNAHSGGISQMKKAFELSKSEIARYSSYSTLIAELRDQSAELHSLLNEHGVSKDGT